MYDTIVVGGGIAGACAAVHLSRQERVLLLEAAELASGASGVAAGMVNPLMGRPRGRPVWRMPEAMAALRELLALADMDQSYAGRPTLRPVGEPDQARWFQEAADRYPEIAQWLPATSVRELYPPVNAPDGALLVRSGGAVDVPGFVRTLLQSAGRAGAEIRTSAPVTGWGEDEHSGWVEIRENEGTERIQARRVLLAMGSSWSDHPELARLNLHHVKGQVVRVSIPKGIDASALPHLTGTGYVVVERDSLVVGSSFEHAFRGARPSRKRSHQLLGKAEGVLPGLKSARILDEMAAVRVEVPGTRLPMVGPLPGRERIWLFTGLGSKGLLMAPLLAGELSGYFARPESIPEETRVREAGA